MTTLLNSRGVLKIQCQEIESETEETSKVSCAWNGKEFYIRDQILNHAAYIACNGLKKDEMFGGYCAITDLGQSQSLRKICKWNRWELNNILTSERCAFMTQ